MISVKPSVNPEIALRVRTGSFSTNYHDQGTAGVPVLFIHGSGPGVSAWANWRLVLPVMARKRRVLAPDMVGFGFTDRSEKTHYTKLLWVQQLLHFLEALEIPRVDVVGNSFGGAIALALAIAHPQKVRRVVLMGSVGVSFPLTEGLDAVWGYTPSLDNMRRLMGWFAYNRALISDELVQLRYQASIQPGFQESFSAMFPVPRQRSIEALASTENEIRALPHPALVIHGREDQVIPLSNSLTLANWIPRAQLHVFPHCGHWTQIEQTARFIRLVDDFLQDPDF